MDNVVLFRLAERIIAVLIGGMAIYLGYKLFLNVPQTDSEGAFKFPWRASVVLTRVGPGVFFALFGSIVVGSSLYRSIQYDEPAPSRSEHAPKRQRTEAGGRFSGAAPSQADNDARADAQMRLQRDIAVLNVIPTQLDPRLSQENRSVVSFAIPRIKFALMEAIWNDSWGSREAFREWVASSQEKVPAGLEKAAEYYRYGATLKP